jgi:hypothetical protein
LRSVPQRKARAQRTAALNLLHFLMLRKKTKTKTKTVNNSDVVA